VSIKHEETWFIWLTTYASKRLNLFMQIYRSTLIWPCSTLLLDKCARYDRRQSIDIDDPWFFTTWRLINPTTLPEFQDPLVNKGGQDCFIVISICLQLDFAVIECTSTPSTLQPKMTDDEAGRSSR
jgi:hypothetical protein